MLCVKNGMIHDALHKEAFRGDILVKDGKIAAIGENLEIPESAEIVDAEGLQVYPGFVEAHGHIGLDGYGIGYEGMDYNEMNDIISPQMRGIDGVKPMDPAFAMARAAGVTCVCVGPGSANVLGGTFTTIKTVGKRVDDMVVRDGVAMKCAFGENPKRVYRDKKDSSRMTTAALLREMLFKTREYKEGGCGGRCVQETGLRYETGGSDSCDEGRDPPESTCACHGGYFRRPADRPGIRGEDYTGTCDRGALDCGRACQRKCTAGCRADPDQCFQI